jgi:hypothetical protein
MEHVESMDMRNARRILEGEHQGKRSLGKPSFRWKGNIKFAFREIWYKSADCIQLAQGLQVD